MPPRTPYRPSGPATDPLLTVHEVATRLRCSVRSVWRYVARGALAQPLRLTTQKVLWRTSDIQAYLDAQASSTTP